MLKLTVYAVALFSLLTAQKAQPQLADSPRPIFMHDARHTGSSPHVGPNLPNIAWTMPWVAINWSAKPVVEDGVEYAIYHEALLKAGISFAHPFLWAAFVLVEGGK